MRKKIKFKKKELTNYYINLGKKIREIRKRKKLTLLEVERLGFTCWKHLQKIETGQKNIKITTLYKLGKIFRVKITRFFE